MTYLQCAQVRGKKTQARDAQRRALVSAVMPDAEALAALATAYARHAQLPKALQFYAQIKRSFRLVVLLACLLSASCAMRAKLACTGATAALLQHTAEA